MRRLGVVSRDDRGVAHDGSAGVSPEGWLPDRVSIGALTKTFPPRLVDRAIEETEAYEQRRRLLPARLVMYFVLALWAVPGPELWVRPGDDQARGRAVSPAAGGDVPGHRTGGPWPTGAGRHRPGAGPPLAAGQ